MLHEAGFWFLALFHFELLDGFGRGPIHVEQPDLFVFEDAEEQSVRASPQQKHLVNFQVFVRLQCKRAFSHGKQALPLGWSETADSQSVELSVIDGFSLGAFCIEVHQQLSPSDLVVKFSIKILDYLVYTFS